MEFSAVAFPEGRRDVSLTVPPAASSTVSGTLGNSNEGLLKERMGRYAGHVSSGIGLNGRRRRIHFPATVQRLPRTFRIIT